MTLLDRTSLPASAPPYSKRAASLRLLQPLIFSLQCVFSAIWIVRVHHVRPYTNLAGGTAARLTSRCPSIMACRFNLATAYRQAQLGSARTDSYTRFCAEWYSVSPSRRICGLFLTNSRTKAGHDKPSLAFQEHGDCRSLPDRRV